MKANDRSAKAPGFSEGLLRTKQLIKGDEKEFAKKYYVWKNQAGAGKSAT